MVNDLAEIVAAGSLTPLKPILTTFEAIFSENTKSYA
jgi:hypothetical protein